MLDVYNAVNEDKIVISENKIFLSRYSGILEYTICYCRNSAVWGRTQEGKYVAGSTAFI